MRHPWTCQYKSISRFLIWTALSLFAADIFCVHACEILCCDRDRLTLGEISHIWCTLSHWEICRSSWWILSHWMTTVTFSCRLMCYSDPVSVWCCAALACGLLSLSNKEQLSSDDVRRKVPASRKSLKFDSASNQWVSGLDSHCKMWNSDILLFW